MPDNIVAALIELPNEVELPAIVIALFANLAFETLASTKLDPFKEPTNVVAVNEPVTSTP